MTHFDHHSKFVLYSITGPKPCKTLNGRHADNFIFRVSGAACGPLSKNTKDTTDNMDCLCYIWTFILLYWQQMESCKLMWSLSKFGPKIVPEKRSHITQQWHRQKPFYSGAFVVLKYCCCSWYTFVADTINDDCKLRVTFKDLCRNQGQQCRYHRVDSTFIMR